MPCKKTILACILSITCGLLLGGCSLRRTVDEFPEIIAQETASMELPETVSAAWMKAEGLDWEAIVPLFLGISEEEAEEYLYPGEEHYYEYNMMTLTGNDYVRGEFDDKLKLFQFLDDREGAPNCYLSLLKAGGIRYDFLTTRATWRMHYPEEDLDVCTKEEAIEACRPYMELIGYEDAEVTSFAITMEAIEKAQSRWEAADTKISAPGPGFVMPTMREYNELWFEGKQEDEIYEILGIDYIPAEDRGIEWSKKDEAFMLIYQPYINGTLIESTQMLAVVIYAPQYSQPVYISALVPPVIDEVIEEGKLVSREAAMEELMLSYWVESLNDIQVKSMELASSIVLTEDPERVAGKRYQMTPSWEITFQLKDRLEAYEQTVLVDALSGNIIK